MKILLVHNFYQRYGGESAVVTDELELLRAHGQVAELHAVDNDDIHGVLQAGLTALRLTYSWPARRKLAEKLANFSPDVVHVHNFFPKLTPAIYDACQEKGVPVVQTLHNFRIFCPNALFLREGQICESCLNGSPFRAVAHGCYRSSRLGSLAVARMVSYHRRHRTWQNKVDCFIALSAFSRSKFIQGGIPPERILVKPNFVPDLFQAEALSEKRPARSTRALFVGRLSEEKGVATLLSAWQGLDVPLRIVGDGPMALKLHENPPPWVSLLGQKTPGEVAVEMEHATFLILPSLCYENAPLVLAEAFSHGLPVIASRLGSLAEFIEDGKTGLHFSPGDPCDLAAKVQWAIEHPVEMNHMGLRARKYYLRHFTPGQSYQQLMKLYQAVIHEKNLSR
jgi:glycosyltransferase involved in cell wall biosynthesis